MSFTFSIIGGGLTGTSMLYQFVTKLRKAFDHRSLGAAKIKVQVFEKQNTFGPGFPHSERNVMPFHITNMCAKDMGILSSKKSDFQDWVTYRKKMLEEHFPWLHDASFTYNRCSHYPRAIMGEYLKERFHEACQIAQTLGVSVDLYPQTEVVDLKQKRRKIVLTIFDLRSKSTFSCVADRVLLATGHWVEEKRSQNFFPSPWPAQNLLQNIPAGEKIAVLGTSLSAIEVVLTLTSDGRFSRHNNRLDYIPSSSPRRLTLYSRRGLLPKVRGKMGKYRNRYLSPKKIEHLSAFNKGVLTLDTLFQLLNRELKTVYGYAINWKEVVNPRQSPLDLLKQYIVDAKMGDGSDGELLWQTVLHQSFDMIREIYPRLRQEDRKRFDDKYASLFFTHAATQPIINAEKTLALMRAGFVDIIKLGREYQININDSEETYEITYKDQLGIEKRAMYRYVVNARGQSKSIETDPSPLIQRMLKSGLIQTGEAQIIQQLKRQGLKDANPTPATDQRYKTESIWIDPATHQLMRLSSDNIASKLKAVYAVGAMTRGQIIDTSTANGIVKSTSRIANDLVNELKK